MMNNSDIVGILTANNISEEKNEQSIASSSIHLVTSPVFNSSPSPSSAHKGIRILIIDNFDSFTHNLSQLLLKYTGVPPLTLYNTAPLSLLLSLLPVIDAIVISPGPGHPSVPTDFGLCQDLLSPSFPNLIASRSLRLPPILGVCLGLQGLVVAYGGEVLKADQCMHGRLSFIYHSQAEIFATLPSPFLAVRYNSLVASSSSFPSSLRITATTSQGEIMAVSHRSLPIFTVQFHPESICTQGGNILIYNFLSEVVKVGRADKNELINVRIERRWLNGVPSVLSNCWYSPFLSHLFNPTIPASIGIPALKPQTYLHHTSLSYLDSESVFLTHYSQQLNSWWLDSALTENGRARFSYMGDMAGPLSFQASYNISNQTLTSTNSLGQTTTQQLSTTFLSYADTLLQSYTLDSSAGPLVNSLPLEFIGGWVGYIGYEMKNECQAAVTESDKNSWKNKKKENNFDENKESEGGFSQETEAAGDVNSSPPPSASFIFADRFIAFDHQERTCHLLSLYTESTRAEQMSWHTKIKKCWNSIKAADSLSFKTESINQVTFNWRHSREKYQNLIRQCLELIKEGESYELCLTNQLSTSRTIDALLFHRCLRHFNPAPHAAYFNFPSFSIVSSSPERFLRVNGRNNLVECRPIKGTIKRGKTLDEDENQKQLLLNSEKDFSENLMIVDLIRNDLGRVCNNVTVPHLMQLESYATLHTLVTTVHAELPNTLSPLLLLESTFPPGSMTGAPKLRATILLESMEEGNRGVYSGCIGFASVNLAVDHSNSTSKEGSSVNNGSDSLDSSIIRWGSCDWNVVIRTGIVTSSGVSIGAGGAIVDGSDPVSEWEEIELKATALKKAIDLAWRAEKELEKKSS